MQKWNLSSCCKQVSSQFKTFISAGAFRTLLVFMALLISISTQADYKIEKIENITDQNSAFAMLTSFFAKAEVTITGKKPEIEGLADYTIDRLALQIGEEEYPVSFDPSKKYINDTAMVKVDLNSLVGSSTSQLVLTYYLTFDQYIYEISRCIYDSNSTWMTIFWFFYPEARGCISKILQLSLWRKLDHTINTTASLREATKKTITRLDKDTDKILEALKARTKNKLEDNKVAAQVERLQYEYILFEATQDYIKIKKNSKDLRESINRNNMIKMMGLLLPKVSDVFYSKNCSDELGLADVLIENNLNYQEIMAPGQEESEKSNPHFASLAKGLATDICKYSHFQFTLQRTEAIDIAKEKDQLQYYGFCNKYFCRFDEGEKKYYTVVRSLLSKQQQQNIDEASLISIGNDGLQTNCTDDYCFLKDQQKVNDIIEEMEESSNTLVGKYYAYKLFEGEAVSESNLTENKQYKVDLIKDQYNQTIHKLTDDTFKTFYWSSHNKNVYYVHNPRFVDSDYVVRFYAPHMSKLFDSILAESKRNEGNSNKKTVELSDINQLSLDCYGEFSALNDFCAELLSVSKKDAENDVYKQQDETLEDAIKKDTKANQIVSISSLVDPENRKKYCRIPQKETDKQLGLPVAKPSEINFIKKMEEQDHFVICFTFEFDSSASIIENIIARIKKNNDLKDIHYAVDCEAMDKNISVHKGLSKCSFNEERGTTRATLFLALPTEKFLSYTNVGKLSFENFFKNYRGVKLYSELPPWGNLKNTVKDRKAMFAQSSIERVEIDTTSTTSTYAMFASADKINAGNFKYWDTSKITDMSLMFFNATSFNQPIGKWNTSSVVDIKGLFWNATNFNQPIDEWDTSKITDMVIMFLKAKNFNQPIDNWDTSKVTEISCMFRLADAFNKERLDSFWKAKKVQLKSNGITKKKLTCAK